MKNVHRSREEIYSLAWNIYERHQDYVKKEKVVRLFPSSTITQLYKELFKIIKSRMPDKADNLSILDISHFIINASDYVEDYNGFRVGAEKIVGFLTDQEFEKGKKGVLRVDDSDGFEKYELIGNDKMVIYRVRTKFEQFKIMMNYMLFGEPDSVIYYFRLGKASNFPTGYLIGTGSMYHFNELPESVKQSFALFKSAEKYLKKGPVTVNPKDVTHLYHGRQTDEFQAIVVPLDPVEENPIEKDWDDDTYMKVQLETVGQIRGSEKAILEAKRNVNIIKLIYGVDVERRLDQMDSPWDYYEGKVFDLAPDEKLDFRSEKKGSVSFAKTSAAKIVCERKENLDYAVSSINKILSKGNKTDLESSIINAIEIFGMIDASTPLHVRFILCMISLESLLISGKPENILYKLSEKVTFLIGDSESWLHFYLRDETLDRESFNKDLFKRDIIQARRRLNKMVGDLYNKRSGFAHTGFVDEKRSITEQDYAEATNILRLTLIKLLYLYNNGDGILYIGKRPDSRYNSLDEYIENLKYSGAIDRNGCNS
jgi:Apea-like HEPN